jgi:hypothetical protein
MTVTAASVYGHPSVDVLEGGQSLRIWPSGRYGSLIAMSVADWRALSNLVNSEILAAGTVR